MIRARVAALIIKILLIRGEKGREGGREENEAISVTSRGIKAFSFNYNRSQRGSPSASTWIEQRIEPGGEGEGRGREGAVLSAVSHSGSYVGVKTTTQICRTFYLIPLPARSLLPAALLEGA